jgi:hypothetical protein
VPSFELHGPGVNIVSNLSGGEVTSATALAAFLPSSTYTWRNDANGSVVNTFVTSSTVVGPPPPSPVGIAAAGGPTNKPTANSNVVGADVVPFRGTLSGTVTAAGGLTIAFDGKRATTLRAGRYRISITSSSTTGGFMLETPSHKTWNISGSTPTGKHTASLDLTAGRWTVIARHSKTGFAFIVT